MTTCRTYTASQARANFTEVIDKALFEGPVFVTRHRRKVAVVSADLLTRLIEYEASMDAQKADAAMNEFLKDGGTPMEIVKRELGID